MFFFTKDASISCLIILVRKVKHRAYLKQGLYLPYQIKFYLLYYLFSKLTKGSRYENTKQKIEDTINTHKQAMETLASHQKTVDELSDAYDKLSKGVDVDTNQNLSLSDEEYQSYINTIKELVDIFPSLQTGLDENGNAILSLGKNGRSASEDLRELLKAEEELNNYKISQDIALLFANVLGK